MAVWAIATLFASGAGASGGPVFSTILSGGGQDYATSVVSDSQGNVYVGGLTYSSDFPVTTGAAQTKFGGTADAFIAKIGPDGKVLWATYLGGILDESVTGIALDRAGNVLVAGWSRSPDFPFVNPILNRFENGGRAFVAKFDPTGSKLLYSTFLGAHGSDSAVGIAVDAGGNAFVAVNSTSATDFPGTQGLPGLSGILVTKLDPQGALAYSFFHPGGTATAIALDTAGAIYITGSSSLGLAFSFTQPIYQPYSLNAMVFKVAPDGSKMLYEKSLGGSVQTVASAIAVNSAGEAWIGGATSSTDFPLVKPLQTTTGGRPLWKTTDGGSTFTPLDDLPFALPQMTVADPTNPTTLYEATGDLGLFKSVDGGLTWKKAATGISGTNVTAIAIDPTHPQTLYATVSLPGAAGAMSGAIYKSVNGAATWTLIDSTANSVPSLAVDAQNPNIVWENGATLRKSTDAGATWKAVAFPGPSVASFALDPNASGHVFAVSNFIFCSFNCTGVPTTPFLYRSVDGGATWIQVPSVVAGTPVIVDGSTNPSTVYDGLAYRSDDGGLTWTHITLPPAGVFPTAAYPLAVDSAGTLYTLGGAGIIVSHDHAQTWTVVGTFNPGFFSFAPAGSAGTLYATSRIVGSSGFVSKLSADGSTLQFSTYLRAHPGLAGSAMYSGEPGSFNAQNWISAIALDSAGNATVAGTVRGPDLPVANPSQAANAGLADAFVSTIAANGSKLTYSTYFGGSQDDGALAVALDSQGNVIIAGQTWSPDFPVPGGPTLPFSYGDGFVAKLIPPGPPVISQVANGASYLPGVEGGSWVMIKGSNLANTNPGRIWRTDEVVNGNLPTALDGVSVTIDGKPAFIYYISPTQINVQAPSNTNTGPVNVVVNNNGAISAPATAQVQNFAPAFFGLPYTTFAVATRLPDYALVADPGIVPGAVAAKPGDYIALWATGFGATNPPVPAGVAVTGAPAAATMPKVTVGGVQVPVVSVVLTTGCAGLYQVTIQLPDTLPAGTVAVQASVGGFQSPGGVTLYIGK